MSGRRGSEPAGPWDGAPKRRDSAARQVEGKDQVVDAVGGADLVAHVHQDSFRAVRVGQGLHLDVADAEFVLGERLFHVVPDQRLRGGVVRGEDEVVDAASPLRTHLPLAQRGADDDAHRLLDVRLVSAELDGAVRPHGEGELEADAEEVAHGVTRMRAGYAVAIATSTTRLQLGQVTMVRPCRSSTWSPSGALHSGQRSPLVRPALTASMISYQTDSSAVRRSSARSSMSAKAPSFDAPGASQPRLNCEATCSREADPYLARWGAIKPPPG